MHTHPYGPITMLPAVPELTPRMRDFGQDGIEQDQSGAISQNRSFEPTLLIVSASPGSPHMGIFNRTLNNGTNSADTMQTHPQTYTLMAVHRRTPTKRRFGPLFPLIGEENQIEQTMQTQPVPSVGSFRDVALETDMETELREMKKTLVNARPKASSLPTFQPNVSYSLILTHGYTFSLSYVTGSSCIKTSASFSEISPAENPSP